MADFFCIWNAIASSEISIAKNWNAYVFGNYDLEAPKLLIKNQIVHFLARLHIFTDKMKDKKDITMESDQ